jgi:hypothetical protein
MVGQNSQVDSQRLVSVLSHLTMLRVHVREAERYCHGRIYFISSIYVC